MAYAYRLNHRGGFKAEAVTLFGAVAQGAGSILVYWSPPAKHYSGIMVRYSVGAYPPTIADGTLGGDGAGSDYVVSGASVKGFLISGLTPGTTYYFSGFSYYQSGSGSRKYADSIVHASAAAEQVDPSPSDYSGTSVVIDGIGLGLTGDGVYTVPAGITSLDVFCVGGGGGGGGDFESYSGNHFCGGGGGGGRTATALAVTVTPGQQITVTIGAGGTGGAFYRGGEDDDGPAGTGAWGGTTYFGSLCSASGGDGGAGGSGYGSGTGGAGGSGGGGGGARVEGYTFGGDGGTNGGSGQAGYNGRAGGAGQGTSTHAFGGSAGIAYSGGGGGGVSGNGGATGGGNGGSAGTANTGGGGGGGNSTAGASGGSGIVIIRAA